MKIDHNRVLMSRGESAVYVREITMGDKYNTPYMLLSDFVNPTILLNVKSNKNDKDSVLSYEAPIGEALPRFTSRTVVNVDLDDSTVIDTVKQYGVLYRAYESDKYNHYYYKPAEGYDKTKTYPLGYIVIYNTVYYKCSTAITSPEEFNPSHWSTAAEDETGNPTLYTCVFRLDIQSDDTKKLRPATYYYDISMVAKTGDDIDYKEVWLEPTEFIIGGSY